MDDKLAIAKLNVFYQQNVSVFSNKPEYDVRTSTYNNKPLFTAILKYAGQIKEGTAPSKNEAKRLAACKMLIFLNNKNSSNSSTETTARSIYASQEIQLEEFDANKLSVHFDTYLENRQRNASLFNRDFVKNVAENLSNHFENVNAGFKSADSPKSEILDAIIEKKLEIPEKNAPPVFERILEQMDLKYYAEFIEVTKNDKYAVMIKINFNLFTIYGVDKTPEKTIQTACKNAIEFLTVFNS